MPDVKLPQFPMGVQVSGEDMIPAAQNGTSGLIKVKDVRNIASTIAEGGTEKTASNENLKTVNQKVDTLSQSVDTSFQTVNQNFVNVENEIESANNAITAANQNVTNHEGDTGLHVTPEKQSKWDGYATQLSENTQNIAKLSNPNLLINGDFQVWQRGTNFVSNGNYTADRWKNNYSVVEKVTDGMKITPSVNTAGVSHELEFQNYFKGKTFTLSLKSDDTVGKYNIAYNDGTTSYLLGKPNKETVAYTFTLSATATKLKIIINIDNTTITPITLNWVKLELGDKATPFIPRLYAEELALCQRYFQSHNIRGVATTTSTLMSVKPYFMPMRIAPTPSNWGTQFVTSSVGYLDAGTISNAYFGTSALDSLITTATLTIGRPYAIDVKLDAEIY